MSPLALGSKSETWKMKSGPHTHFCPKCKQHKECPILTHCRRAHDSVCMDCEYDDALTAIGITTKKPK